MNCELNGRKIKYEDGKLWLWKEIIYKPSYWFELKVLITSSGYERVKINYKTFLFHRVVYFIHNQEWDIHNSSTDNSIDHIDRNQLNNSIENLRVATHSQNMWNQGAKGYYFNKNAGKYLARINVNGKDKHLGLFVNPEDARQAYVEAKKIYHVM